MKLVIENTSNHDDTINLCYRLLKNGEKLSAVKEVIAATDPSQRLFCGKGGSHIWFKDRNNIDTRLAIIYL